MNDNMFMWFLWFRCRWNVQNKLWLGFFYRIPIASDQCLFCPPLFSFGDDLSRASHCKLAFNGMRRSDLASSRVASPRVSFLFHSFLFERPRGRSIVPLSIVLSKHERARIATRREFVTRARESIDLAIPEANEIKARDRRKRGRERDRDR